MEEAKLPSTLTQLGEFSFASCYALPEIEVPAGVTTIPQQCFAFCKGAKKVTLHEGLENIGFAAFGADAVLDSIVVPNSVKTIGNMAFTQCDGLHKISLGTDENCQLTSLGEKVFTASPNLNRIECWATVPPTANENTFDSGHYTGATLGVQDDDNIKNRYKTANVWKNFFTVTGRDDIAVESEVPYSVNGNEVSFGDAAGAVYNVAGQLVGQGNTVVLPSKGIYIIVCNGKSFKLAR